jgi:hypothetical protein
MLAALPKTKGIGYRRIIAQVLVQFGTRENYFVGGDSRESCCH